jgi:hypothetical protein
MSATATPTGDEIAFDPFGILVEKLMGVSPSQGDHVRNDFVGPLARMLGGKSLVPLAIGNAYVLAADLFEAGGDTRSAMPFYSQATRMLGPIMPTPKINLVLPYVQRPDDRMIQFGDRATVIKKLASVDASSAAYREYFPGALANRVAGQKLCVGKVVRAYIAAAAELRDQPLFADEVGGADGKRDIAFLFDTTGVGRKVLGSVMEYNLSVRVMRCLTEKVPQPVAAAA